MKSKQKILFITTGLAAGGAEIALYRILSHLKDDFEIEVISLSKGGEIAIPIQELGVFVHKLDFERLHLVFSQIYKFFSIIYKFKPDIIQGWMYHGNLFSYLGKVFLTPKPKLFLGIRQSLHDISIEKITTRFAISLDAFCSAYANKIIYNSDVGKILHEEYGYKNSIGTTIPNGFDTEAFRPSEQNHNLLCQELNIDPKNFIIGMIARFHPVKDHKTFINAAGIIAKKYPNIHFVMAGKGINLDNEKLRELIQQHHLDQKVHLLGARKDIPYITSALNIATNCSISEGFANNIGEALACGVVCVATDVGDSKKIIGDAGFIIPVNSPESLAKAWQQLIEMPQEERKKYSQLSRTKIMEYYSIKSIASKYKKLYLAA